MNGEYAGLIHGDGSRPKDIADRLCGGKNTIEIRVSGSLKNLLGPHFMKNPVRGSAWPSMWKDAPTFTAPRPEGYDLLAYGLTVAPTLIIG